MWKSNCIYLIKEAGLGVTMLQRRYPCFLNRYYRILIKCSHSDSSLVADLPKIKSLMNGDFKRGHTKEFKSYFIEKLFLNRFQNEVLEYPQISALVHVNEIENHARITEKLLASETENEVSLLEDGSSKAVSCLKKHELIGFKISQIKNGFGYLQSEYTYMQEVLGRDPSLSKTVCEQEDFGIYLIDKFGSDLQKDKYLSKLISGENIASFASIEKETAVSLLQNSCNTSAKLLSDNESYIISGTKCWVYNANCADLFIVSAVIKSNDEVSKPTLFLIDKNTPGVEVHESIEKIGLKKLMISDVTFNNVAVPKSSVLGNIHEGDEIIQHVLSQGKLSNGGHCIGIMRKFLDRAIKHCIYNDFYHKSKTESSYFKSKVANMASRLYVVESMTYLLTGRMDCHIDPDVFLESLIIKIFASETLQFIIKETLEILGPDFFSSQNEDLVELTKDSQFFVACDDANDDLRLILSTVGLKYTMNYRKRRGILELFSDIINQEKTLSFMDTPNFIHHKDELEGYLHQMFCNECHLMEDSIFILAGSARYLLQKYKDDVYNRHSELRYIADMVIEIYAMAATLARGSRAYCIGVKFAEFDRSCVEAEVRRSSLRVREKKILLRRPEELISKYPEIAHSIMNCNKYSEFTPALKSLTIR